MPSLSRPPQNELRRLKADNENLREQQKKLVSRDSGGSAQSPLRDLATFFPSDEVDGHQWSVNTMETSASRGDQLYTSVPLFGGDGDSGEGVEGGRGGGGGEGWEEFHDFGDLVSSQSEINQLRSELERVRVESQHWKMAAQVSERERTCRCTLLVHVCLCVNACVYIHVHVCRFVYIMKTCKSPHIISLPYTPYCTHLSLIQRF